MPEETYFEIDEPSDWIIIENLLNNRRDNYNEKKIKLFITDCDGCLTDGGMYYDELGNEWKKFNAKDGMGFKILRQNNILTGIITGENTHIVERRAEKLKLDELYQGVTNKSEILDKMVEKYNLSYEEVAYVGDDINDIAVLEKVRTIFHTK